MKKPPEFSKKLKSAASTPHRPASGDHGGVAGGCVRSRVLGGRSAACGSTRQGGFSLLEILVAFAILALTLGVLLRIFGGGVRSVALADEHAQAVLFAESLLARVGSETPVVAGESNGELDEKYRWVLRITPYVSESLPLPENMPAKPYWVEALVQWGEEDEFREFSLGTLRLATDTGALGVLRR